MSDKRRQASRIQGQWASASRQPRPQQSSVFPTCSTVTFSEPSDGIQQAKKPEDIVIVKDGSYVLSTDENGRSSSVQLYSSFMEDEEERAIMYETLLNSVPWTENFAVIRGNRVRMPRLMAWYGPLPYDFSGSTLPAVETWPPVIALLHDRIRSVTGNEFNSVLLNLYRDGKDSVAWHSDDELFMGISPTIASLSFGETRMFEMRKKLLNATPEECERMQHVKIPLKDGSLLIMEGETQKFWQVAEGLMKQLLALSREFQQFKIQGHPKTMLGLNMLLKYRNDPNVEMLINV